MEPDQLDVAHVGRKRTCEVKLCGPSAGPLLTNLFFMTAKWTMLLAALLQFACKGLALYRSLNKIIFFDYSEFKCWPCAPPAQMNDQLHSLGMSSPDALKRKTAFFFPLFFLSYFWNSK